MFKNKIIKFLFLSYKDKIVVFNSIHNIIYSILILKFYGFKKSFDSISNKYKLINNEKTNYSEIQKLSKLISGTANVLPIKLSCLQKSFSLWMMLRKVGIDSDLMIGINNITKDFSAHAWVELEGNVLNDKPDISNDFTVINLSVNDTNSI